MMDMLLIPIFLCFLRVSAFVAFLPPFGGQHLPNTVKVGLAVALTAFWMPLGIPLTGSTTAPGTPTTQSATALSQQEGNSSLFNPSTAQRTTTDSVVASTAMNSPKASRRWMYWTWLGCREILLGASMGWLLGMILIPMRIAGAWLADHIGLNIASLTSGTDTGSGNILAVIIELCGVLMLYSLSIHHDFLRIFNRSFDQYQVGQAWEFPGTASIIGMLTSLPERGLAIAAPLAVIFLLIMVVLMFAMKQSPQFNLMTFGMPFRLAAGLLAMLVMFPDMLSRVATHLQGFLINPV